MINRKIALVVGAGASKDVGLPLGWELKIGIADCLTFKSNSMSLVLNDQNRDIHKCIANFSGGDQAVFERLIRKANFIAQNMIISASIDNFLDTHRDDAEILWLGKLAIADRIFKEECHSSLSNTNMRKGRVIDESEECFINEFLKLLVKGHPLGEISRSSSNVTFVIFNYDRCIERYLNIWLSSYCGGDCSEIMKGFNFIDVYGDLGRYIHDSGSSDFGVPEGSIFLNAHYQLPPIAERIRIFTEQNNSEVVAQIEAAVNSASLLMFLGFGFERQNMELFPRATPASNMKTVMGTVYGLSESDINSVNADLSNRFRKGHGTEYLFRGKCNDIFKEFSHSIAQSVS